MAKRYVLVVDDDIWLSELFVATLRAHGYEAAAIHNGIAAMDAIDSERPVAIVLDVMMPGPNGIVLLHELQSHADLADIPVLLCTNSADAVDSSYLRSYGVCRLLDKTTMRPEDVVTAVRACV